MSNRIINTLFIFLCIPLPVFTLHASSELSLNQACTKPIVANSKIFTICNDLNNTNRTVNHPVFLTEINHQLEVVNNTKLPITDNDIGRLIKRDSENAYLIGETRSKCIQLFNINLNSKSTTSLLRYCDGKNLSLPFEVTNQSLILNDQSLLLPLYSKESNVTTIKIIGIDKDNKAKVLHVKKYKNYQIISFVQFDNRSLLLLRSKKDPLNAVVLAVMEDATGKLQYTELYETSTFLIMTLSNINNRILIAGNQFNQSQMFFTLRELFLDRTSTKLIDKWPIPLRPTLLLSKLSTMKLYGVLLDENFQAFTVSIFDVNPIDKIPLKVTSLHKLKSREYPLALVYNQKIGYLITGSKASSILSDTGEKELLYSDISAAIYPNIFEMDNRKYIFYIVQNKGQLKSVFEEL